MADVFTHYIGIDVQSKRSCACAIVRADGSSEIGLWGERASDILQGVRSKLLNEGASLNTCVVAIDSPRKPLLREREWYWNGRSARWRRRLSSDVGLGRHCEVVISAHKLASPQWTPLTGAAPPWMSVGFDLFDTFADLADVLEVFPSVTYKQLRGQYARVSMDLGTFDGGSKDMLDAYVCAFTAAEFVAGRGAEVGGGDGLGSIVLARPIECPIADVMIWPASA